MQAAVPVTPNAIAWLVYYLFPLVGLAIFFMFRAQVAVLIVIFLGLLFLPERIAYDPPLMPPLTKHYLTFGVATVGCLIRRPNDLLKPPPIMELVFPIIIFCSIGTWLGNTDTLVYGVSVLNSLGFQDAVSGMIEDTFTWILPFFIGRAMFTNSKDLRLFVTGVAGAGFIYSFFCMWEMRMSPQLHNQIYGYHQHEFIQTIRWGGYRPMVFMGHGIGLSIFMLVAALYSIASRRARLPVLNIKSKFLWGYMVLIFIFCKSTGAIIEGLLAIPIAIWAKPRLTLRLAVVVTLLIVAYPTTKLSDTFPAETLVDAATALNPARASSLSDRFENDILLMARARERLLFGWGPFARSRCYNSAGNDIAIPDGFWVMTLGAHGLIAFVCVFLLLLWPVQVAARTLRKIQDPKDQILVSTIALAQVFLVVDLLPNSAHNSLAFFFSGALMGVCRGLARAPKRAGAPVMAPQYAAPGVPVPSMR